MEHFLEGSGNFGKLTQKREDLYLLLFSFGLMYQQCLLTEQFFKEMFHFMAPAK